MPDMNIHKINIVKVLKVSGKNTGKDPRNRESCVKTTALAV